MRGIFEVLTRTSRGLTSPQQLLLTHGDSVQQVPAGFSVCARSGSIMAAIEHVERQIYGVQFHPEVTLSVNGKDIISNFLFGVAKCSG